MNVATALVDIPSIIIREDDTNVTHCKLLLEVEEGARRGVRGQEALSPERWLVARPWEYGTYNSRDPYILCWLITDSLEESEPSSTRILWPSAFHPG